jgi:colicin import membrane protein
VWRTIRESSTNKRKHTNEQNSEKTRNIETEAKMTSKAAIEDRPRRSEGKMRSRRKRKRKKKKGARRRRRRRKRMRRRRRRRRRRRMKKKMRKMRTRMRVRMKVEKEMRPLKTNNSTRKNSRRNLSTPRRSLATLKCQRTTTASTTV